MSYQVLARKYRPKSFAEVIGQEHILQILINSFAQNRLHHAYLFTGTRGVGKTTLARILAKCFNCEQGPTATPCGTCEICKSVDIGNAVDLIEIDAASRTKVEDMRELLNNVQYMPSVGRYKIYLIDEVHMLSGHSFNALLKTLEEPPEHVRFLFATTEKNKIPITILSRCLQFSLKNIPRHKIAAYLKEILVHESIGFEEAALYNLAGAADGSVRDALSLLDQAIMCGHGAVYAQAVDAMLGSVATDKVLKLLVALSAGDVGEIFNIVQNLDELASSFTQVLESLLILLQRVALSQFVKNASVAEWEYAETLKNLAQKISPQDVQLYYQIGLMGKRDLALAPTLRVGFEMLMLRMLAFTPATEVRPEKKQLQPEVEVSKVNVTEINLPQTAPAWLKEFARLKLSGATLGVMRHCAFHKYANGNLELFLEPEQAPLLNKKYEERIAEVLSESLQQKISVTIKIGGHGLVTLASLDKENVIQKNTKAKQDLAKDDKLQNLINAFTATLLDDTVSTKE